MSKLQDRIQEGQTRSDEHFQKNQGRVVEGQHFTTKQMVFIPRDPEPASFLGQEHRAQGRVVSPSLWGASSASDVTVSPLSVIFPDLSHRAQTVKAKGSLPAWTGEGVEWNRREPGPAFPSDSPLWEKALTVSRRVLRWLAGGSTSSSLVSAPVSTRWDHCKKHSLCPPKTQKPVRAGHYWNHRQAHSIPKVGEFTLCPMSRPGLCSPHPELSPSPGPLTPRGPSHQGVYRLFPLKTQLRGSVTA